MINAGHEIPLNAGSRTASLQDERRMWEVIKENSKNQIGFQGKHLRHGYEEGQLVSDAVSWRQM